MFHKYSFRFLHYYCHRQKKLISVEVELHKNSIDVDLNHSNRKIRKIVEGVSNEK